MKKRITLLKIIISVLFLGIGGVLVYSILLNKNHVALSKGEIDINSDLVKKLVYPTSNSKPVELNNIFILKTENINNYDRDAKITASFNVDGNNKNYVSCDLDSNNNIHLYSNDGNHSMCIKYKVSDIEKSYHQVFGPDTQYINGTINTTYCGVPKYYDDASNAYYAIIDCGGIPPYVTSIKKTYKAVKNEEYLYIYDYALILLKHDALDKILLFESYSGYENYKNSQSTTTVVGKVSSDSQAKSKLNKLIKTKKAKTYIWTFKKQSDGKYYYYSSKWADEQ